MTKPLRPFEHNPRQITERDDKALDASMQELGDLACIVHDHGTDEIIDGNQRSRLLDLFGQSFDELRASGKIVITKEFDKPDKQGTILLGWIDTPKGWFAYRGVKWNEAQRKKANIKGNLTAGHWDWDLLIGAFEAQDLISYGFDAPNLKAMKYDIAALGNMLESEKPDDNYSRKIEAPIYTPKGDKPAITDLFDEGRTKELIAEIDASDLPEEEKAFLRIAANRHTVLNFKRIAEYYAHSPAPVQRLMENSALVIIDFERAIELGYVKLSEEIAAQYLKDYPDA